MNQAVVRCCWLLLVLGSCFGCRRATVSEDSTVAHERIVSLSPAITETLFVLGAGPRLVAVSDYCHEPSVVNSLTRVGTIFTPRFEAIAQARPTTIVAERIDGTNVAELERLSHTLTYRWLTFDNVIESTRALGKAFGKRAEAERLVATYEQALKAELAARAPRVLLALAHVPGQLNEIWFIRNNSFHGRALEAAGAKNAVAEDVVGPPRLGLERAIQLDPDGIILLQPAENGNQALLDDYRRLTGLRAVRDGKLALVAAPELQVPGPRIVRFVERLRTALAKWGTN
jgi:iron complex transport system substrate-binding protein